MFCWPGPDILHPIHAVRAKDLKIFLFLLKYSQECVRVQPNTEEKARVVAAVWGTELIKFLA